MSSELTPSRGRPRKHSNEDIIDDLREVADIAGRPPTIQEHLQHGDIHPQTIISRFGTWAKALDEAGYDIGHRERVSKGPTERVTARLSAASVEAADELVKAGVYRTRTSAIQAGLRLLLQEEHQELLNAVGLDIRQEAELANGEEVGGGGE